MNQRPNHGNGDDPIGGESENPGYFVVAATIGHHNGNQQEQDNQEQQPTRTQGQALRECQVHTGGSQHGNEGGPTRFTENLIAHNVAAKERASSLIQLLLSFARMPPILTADPDTAV